MEAAALIRPVHVVKVTWGHLQLFSGVNNRIFNPTQVFFVHEPNTALWQERTSEFNLNVKT